MSPLTNITRYIPHIIQLKFSVNNTHHITTKIEPQNYIFPTQSPTSFSLWVKPKESPNFLKSYYDVANLKSHYDVANSMSHYDVANSMSYYNVANSKSYYDVANSKCHCDVANSKSATMRYYLQSPLLHSTSKTRYDLAPLKPVITRHHLLSPLLHGNILQNLKIIFTKPK